METIFTGDVMLKRRVNKSLNSEQHLGNSGNTQAIKLKKTLNENITLFNNIFSGDETLKTRVFQNRYLADAKCCIVYFSQYSCCCRLLISGNSQVSFQLFVAGPL